MSLFSRLHRVSPVILEQTITSFAVDDRAVSEQLALGILLSSALILAVSLAIFVLVNG